MFFINIKFVFEVLFVWNKRVLKFKKIVHKIAKLFLVFRVEDDCLKVRKISLFCDNVPLRFKVKPLCYLIAMFFPYLILFLKYYFSKVYEFQFFKEIGLQITELFLNLCVENDCYKVRKSDVISSFWRYINVGNIVRNVLQIKLYSKPLRCKPIRIIYHKTKVGQEKWFFSLEHLG